MKTVTEVSRLTGVSVRTLHHYDAIGLLPPTRVTEAGYRLYNDEALEQLCLIIVYRELGFPLKDIREILSAPDFDRCRALDQQIGLLEKQKAHIQHRIDFAHAMKSTGGTPMKQKDFHPSKMDDHRSQAKALWSKTDAWQEFEQKSAGRSEDAEKALGGDLMALFARLGTLREHAPDSEIVQAWVKDLQSFITAHYYNCTDQILFGLGQMYAAGGSMTENIDAAGGEGTGAFARDAITHYCGK